VDYLFYSNPSGYINMLQTAGGMGLDNFKSAVDTIDAKYSSYGLVTSSLLKNTAGLMELVKTVGSMGAEKFTAATDMLDAMFNPLATAQALYKDPAGAVAFIQNVGTIGADKAKELIQMANLYLGKSAIADEFVNDPKAFNQMINNAAAMGKDKWEATLKEYAATQKQSGTNYPAFQDPQQAGTAQKPYATGKTHGEISYLVDPTTGKIYTSQRTTSDTIWVKDVDNVVKSTGDGITKDSHFAFTYNADGSLKYALETKYSDATGKKYQTSLYNSEGVITQTQQYDGNGNLEYSIYYTKNPATGNLDVVVKDPAGNEVAKQTNSVYASPTAKAASYKERAFNGQIGNPSVSSGNGLTILTYPDGTQFTYDEHGDLISSGTFTPGSSSGGSSSSGGRDWAGEGYTATKTYLSASETRNSPPMKGDSRY
jgi:hypothetical protein